MEPTWDWDWQRIELEEVCDGIDDVYRERKSFWVCPECYALVVDKDEHIKWHQRVLREVAPK